jgi:hypothetical protein
MKVKNPSKIAKAVELKKTHTVKEVQEILKKEFGSGINTKQIKLGSPTISADMIKLLKGMYNLFNRNKDYLKDFSEKDIEIIENIEKVLVK